MRHMYDLSVIEKAIQLKNNSQDPNVTSYLEFGFIIRAFQIREAYIFLNGLSQDDTIVGPLPNNDFAYANLCLNSFYYNMFGALDNLTWIIKYRYNIFPDINESHRKKITISLLNKEFANELKQKSNHLYNKLCDFKDIYNEIKKMRDLTAHRLPLHIPAGYISTDDRDKYNDEVKKYNEMVNVNTDGLSMEAVDKKIEESTIQLRKIHQFKQFHPVLIQIDPANKTEEPTNFFKLKEKIDTVYLTFFSFSEEVIITI